MCEERSEKIVRVSKVKPTYWGVGDGKTKSCGSVEDRSKWEGAGVLIRGEFGSEIPVSCALRLKVNIITGKAELHRWIHLRSLPLV